MHAQPSSTSRLLRTTSFAAVVGIACTFTIAWLAPIVTHIRFNQRAFSPGQVNYNYSSHSGGSVLLYTTTNHFTTAKHWIIDRGGIGDNSLSLTLGSRNESLSTSPPIWAPALQEPIESIMASDIHLGWPFRSMATRYAFAFRRNVTTIDWHHRQLIELPVGWPKASSTISLPTVILWPGFLANTAIFAMTFFGLRSLLIAVRRSLRRKRGQCASCRYDLRGCASPNCPECGTPTLASTSLTDTR